MRSTEHILTDDFVKVGNIVNARGNHGELKCTLEDFNKLNACDQDGFIFLRINGALVPYRIEYIKQEANLLKLIGKDSRSEITSLIGAEILQIQSKIRPSLEDLSKTQEGTFIGYALLVSGQEIGIITKVEEFPGQIMMTVLVAGSEKYVPLIEEWIIQSKNSNKTLTMNLPEGLV